MTARQPWRERAGVFLPWLLGTALVEWSGTGLFLAMSTLFLVRIAGLGTGQVGAGLTIAGLVALSATLPVGRLADRYGPRNVLIALNLVRAVATGCFLLVDGWWGFLAVSVPIAVTEQAAPPLITSLVGSLVRTDLRTRVLAVHRSVINLGMSVGGLVAGLALGGATREAFTALFAADAMAFGAAALLLLRAEDRRPARARPTKGRTMVLRDRRLLGLTAFDAVISLWQPILNVAFPLWLATRTDAPLRLVGLLYAVATVSCIVLQYPISRLSAAPRQGLRAYTAAALFIATACLGMSAAPSMEHGGTVAVLTASIIVLTLGEMAGVSAAWTLSFALAPPDSRSTYLSIFGAGRTLGGRVAGPLLMTGAVLALGPPGWIALAVLLTLVSVIPIAAGNRLVLAPAGLEQI